MKGCECWYSLQILCVLLLCVAATHTGTLRVSQTGRASPTAGAPPAAATSACEGATRKGSEGARRGNCSGQAHAGRKHLGGATLARPCRAAVALLAALPF